MEDAQIVDLFLQRREEAITETTLKYGGRLQSLAFVIVEDGQTADECVNDTYLQAWNAIPPHEPRTYLYAFLARITRHLALNCCRDRSRLKRKALITSLSTEMEQCLPARDDGFDQLEEKELRDALNRFLQTIGRQKRYLFIRRYWYMDSIEEIARQCGISESNVKTTLYRLRTGLRSYLKKEGFER